MGALVMTSQAKYAQVAISSCHPGINQPRKVFCQDALQELASSIRANGILQPILLRPVASTEHAPTDYEIIAGERRWRAAQLAGCLMIPAMIHEIGDAEAAEIAAVENSARCDLNLIESAQALQRMQIIYGYTQDELSAVLGKSRAYITHALRLLTLPKAIQHYLANGQLSSGHGKILASLPLEQQLKVAKRCLEQGWSVHALARNLKKNRQTPKADTCANTEVLTRLLSEHLGCPTRISTQAERGTLHIDFHNRDILAGILEKLGFSHENW